MGDGGGERGRRRRTGFQTRGREVCVPGGGGGAQVAPQHIFIQQKFNRAAGLNECCKEVRLILQTKNEASSVKSL